MNDFDADIVVLGAGAAGSVVASRLSERGNLRVLLLESGPNYSDLWPADLRNGKQNSMTAHDWGLRHGPTRGQFNSPLPRGRTVGGSSAVNTCIALRGQPYDYDEWGLAEWSFEACLPSFNRLENDLDYPEEDYHGGSGPLPLRRHPREEWTPWQTAFVAAAEHLGFPYCPDTNRPGALGVGPHAMNKIEGQRINAAQAFLRSEVRERANLRILGSTHVDRVLIENGRVRGVEVIRHSKRERIYAKQVIVCAGAIHSPGILLRSGIGPAAELRRLGVKRVVENENVGARLLDHPGCAIFLRPRSKGWVHPWKDPLIQTVIRTRSAAGGEDADLQLQAGSFVPLAPGLNVPFVTMMVGVGKMKGEGSIRYRSKDPFEKPVIRSRLVEDSRDADVAIEGLELIRELADTPHIRALATIFLPRPNAFRNKAAIRKWLPRHTGSGYHPSCTIPMGTDRKVAGCDPRGRVFDVDGLYVADASLFPTIPSSNIHIPTLMLAERFSELFLESDSA